MRYSKDIKMWSLNFLASCSRSSWDGCTLCRCIDCFPEWRLTHVRIRTTPLKFHLIVAFKIFFPHRVCMPHANRFVVITFRYLGFWEVYIDNLMRLIHLLADFQGISSTLATNVVGHTTAATLKILELKTEKTAWTFFWKKGERVN